MIQKLQTLSPIAIKRIQTNYFGSWSGVTKVIIFQVP